MFSAIFGLVMVAMGYFTGLNQFLYIAILLWLVGIVRLLLREDNE